MPVYQRLSENNRPEWCKVTSAGTFRVPRGIVKSDKHYHDCDEYWLIFKGQATVTSGGKHYQVKPGDIVCIRAGDEHGVVDVTEDLESFWFCDATPPGGRTGRLHRRPEDAKGHGVAAG
jgi:mannose-6-phosphate isomerase-like protein (cupin superfamily)